MIFLNNKKIEPDPGKMKKLEEVFPSFFKKTNPQVVVIHAADWTFHDVGKSTGNSTYSQSLIQRVRVHATPDIIKLDFNHMNALGEMENYKFSHLMPTVKDNMGLQFEYATTSGIYREIGHMTTLFPVRDNLLLYYLYYYCPQFLNGGCEPEGTAKYSFFMPEMAASKEKSALMKEKGILDAITSLSADDVKRVLKGLSQGVSENEEQNFTTLFHVLKLATPQQWDVFRDMTKSVASPAASATDGSIPILLSDWMDQGKVKLVATETEEDKPGWYWKGQKGTPQEQEWLKTKFAPVSPQAADQRIALCEYLSNNTELLEKLKTRW